MINEQDLLRELRGTRSQRDFAHATGIDQTRISRIEAGLLTPNEDDLTKWLAACPAEQAARFRAYRETPWRPELQPPFHHPDMETLSLAIRTLERLELAAPTVRGPMRAQLDLYRKDVEACAHALLPLSHRLAFVGPKGVGKTTAECFATGLRVPPAAGRPPSHKDVGLEINTGGTTIGMVSIEAGDAWAIHIEPEPPESVRYFVEELCLLGNSDPDSEGPSPVLSQEVGKALRRMARLELPARKKAGDPPPLDPLKALSEATPEGLVDEVMALINLPLRTRLIFTPAPAESPLGWLQRTFRAINNGTEPTAPLPRRIRVLVPTVDLAFPSVLRSRYEVTVVDTRGIDGAQVLRPDISECLRDPRTVCVLCTAFTGVDSYVADIVRGVDETGGLAAVAPRLALLMLSQKGTAAETTIDGELVGSQEEGYELKRVDVQITLEQMGIEGVLLDFFDASVEAPDRLLDFLQRAIERLRGEWRARVHKQAQATERLLANLEVEGARADVTEAVRRLQLSISAPLPKSRRAVSSHMNAAIDKAHGRTVRAMVVRKGAWMNLDLETYVRRSAAVDARLRWDLGTAGIVAIVENLKSDPELAGAAAVLGDLAETLASTRAAFVERAETAATTLFVYAMQADSAHWYKVQSDGGKGFRERTRVTFVSWLDDPGRLARYELQLGQAWDEEVLAPMRELCDSATDDAESD